MRTKPERARGREIASSEFVAELEYDSLECVFPPARCDLRRASGRPVPVPVSLWGRGRWGSRSAGPSVGLVGRRFLDRRAGLVVRRRIRSSGRPALATPPEGAFLIYAACDRRPVRE